MGNQSSFSKRSFSQFFYFPYSLIFSRSTNFLFFFSSIESSISFLSPIFPPLSPGPVCPDEHPSSTSMPSNDSPVSDWYYLRLALYVIVELSSSEYINL